MNRRWIGVLPAVCSLLAFSSSLAVAQNSHNFALTAKLQGFNSVPSLVSPGTGTFTATVDGNSIDYKLTYTALSSPVFVSHIHFGQRFVNGSIVAFLCGGGNKPACPASGGEVSGTITPSDILAIPAQNFPAGGFAEVLKIIRSGVAYVNVHSNDFKAGEIRGQIRVQRERDDDR